MDRANIVLAVEILQAVVRKYLYLTGFDRKVTLDMEIVIFGSANCKYCKKQINYLSSVFENKDWLYVDVFSDKEAMEIAVDIDVENLPTVLLLNSKMQKIFQKEGTIPADEIFNRLHGQEENCIPLTSKDLSHSESSNKVSILLSYQPKFKKGDTVQAKTYSGNNLNSFVAVSIKEVSPTEDSIPDEILKDYLDRGGRTKIAYLIDLEGIKK